MSLRGVVIGRMDRRVAFYAPQATTDTVTNESITTYALSYECWAERQLGAAGERFESDQQIAQDTITLKVRYNSSSASIDPTYLVVDNSKQYQIESAQEDRRQGVVMIVATHKDNYEDIDVSVGVFDSTFDSTFA